MPVTDYPPSVADAHGAFAGGDAPSLEAIRTCVHCGICLPQCPTYRVLGEEMDSPRGRLYLMRAAAEGRAELTPTFRRHLDLCLGCRACETACPSGVPFGTLLEATRAQLTRYGPPRRRRLAERLVLSLFPYPARVALVLGLLRLYRAVGVQSLVRRSGLLRALPTLAALDALLDDIPRPDPLPELIGARGASRGRVGLLTGCMQRHVFPSTNRAAARLLALAGYDVVAPPGQGCCGALDLHAGRLDEFRARARALVAAFPADLDAIVTSAAGCGSTMKGYAHWLEDPIIERFAAKTRDVSELLADADLPLGHLDARVTYHDACHLAHGQGIRAEPRALLSRIPGVTLVPLADSDLCCGSAGVYNVLEPEMADQLLAMKVDRIIATRAHIVATGNPGCLLQIAKGLRARGTAIGVVHPVELLARSVDAAATIGSRG